tara:strand:- start:973 stop:1224 length:252 start_codon:yes stop_codon:yes gene_type:complete
MNKYENKGLDEEGLPTEEGVYRVERHDEEEEEIEVYLDEIERLCCSAEELGRANAENAEGDTIFHISVRNTGLKFIEKLRDFD